jgi:hypothetical protein
MKPSAVVRVFVAAALGAYVASAFIGLALPADRGTALTESDAVLALRYAFGNLSSDQWQDAMGHALHHPVTRRAFISGMQGETRYTEQVLKVGWPFTMARGFVRTRGAVVERDGALMPQGDPAGGPIAFLPVLPVWPGLLFNGMILTLPLLAVGVAARRLRGSHDTG